MVRTFIKEVILENFMSYRYSRIELRPGLNLITGPNGAGKSSILLGIAVALGQTYTERGRRLGDLIRRGEDVARITVVLDNTPYNGKRLMPRWKYDEIYITRYLRSDGRYWHEINNKMVTKSELTKFLRKVGLNPDNMFIIMHQNMIEEFAFLSPQEKLKLIEDAVGLRSFREAILRAMKKLEHTKSEEEKVRSLLSKAEEKLRKIEEEYNKYKKRLELQESIKRTKAEIAWRHVIELEKELENLRKNKNELEKCLTNLQEKINKLEKILKITLSNANKTKHDLLNEKISLKEGVEKLYSMLIKYSEYYAEKREKLLEYKYTEKELNKIVSEIEELKSALQDALRKASLLSPRIEVERTLDELEENLKKLEIELARIGKVSEEVEEIYKRYLSSIENLKIRAKKVAENKEKILKELEYRKTLWRKKLIELVSGVREKYIKYLSHVDAVGDVRLVNLDDIENAGIVILVGFRGATPTVLDPYTQSGGERTTATMCFLLALQQKILSPFRAIDEFDVHMDPRNREEIFNLILSIVRQNPDVQYLVITPGILTTFEEDMNIIVVQNIRGVSRVGVTA